MKTFTHQAAQGDMLISKIESLPEAVKKADAENGLYVLAHSETGHHHAVKAAPQVQYYHHANDNLVAYLVVENDPVEVEHMRGFDTHESLRVAPGIYEIRRQREYTPGGFRIVAD